MVQKLVLEFTFYVTEEAKYRYIHISSYSSNVNFKAVWQQSNDEHFLSPHDISNRQLKTDEWKSVRFTT